MKWGRVKRIPLSYYKSQAQGGRPLLLHGKGTYGAGWPLMSERREEGMNRKGGNLIKLGSCSATC